MTFLKCRMHVNCTNFTWLIHCVLLFCSIPFIHVYFLCVSLPFCHTLSVKLNRKYKIFSYIATCIRKESKRIISADEREVRKSDTQVNDRSNNETNRQTNKTNLKKITFLQSFQCEFLRLTSVAAWLLLLFRLNQWWLLIPSLSSLYFHSLFCFCFFFACSRMYARARGVVGLLLILNSLLRSCTQLLCEPVEIEPIEMSEQT